MARTRKERSPEENGTHGFRAAEEGPFHPERHGKENRSPEEHRRTERLRAQPRDTAGHDVDPSSEVMLM